MTSRSIAAPTACCAMVLGLATHAQASGGSGAPPMQDCGLERITHFIPYEPLLPHDLPATFTVEAPLGVQVVTLELTKHSVRSDRFKVLVDDGRTLREVDAPAIRTYRGSIAGRPGTSVTGSLLPTGFSGIVTFEDGSAFGIQPLHELCADLPASSVHATYAASDVTIDEAGCALGRPGFDTELYRVAPESGGGGSLAGTTPQQVEVACETDYEFFQKNGSSVTNTVNDIENIIANVNTIYDRDVNIVHEISVMVIRSASTDPYAGTTIDARLNEFDALWGATPLSGAFRDIAHMFSGYNFSGGAIGLAYLGVVCQAASGVGYGIVESRYTTTLTFRVSLSAHELGHNWNCTHCDSDGNDNCHIMCSANGGCGGLNGSNLKLDTRAINEATGFVNAVTCDFTRPLPSSPPFIDDFDLGTALATLRWTYNDGVTISATALNEPTAPNSMNLGSTGTGEYDDDECRTNTVQLGVLAAASVSYFTSRLGVESGEQLFVEYLNSALDWAALNTVTSDGVSVTGFTFHEHILPADARHNQFRLRFRVNGNDTADNWYVDSVRVLGPPANDGCAGAIDVGLGTTPFTTAPATDSIGSLPASCNDGAGTVCAKDIWFRHVATCDGTLTVETCGSPTFDSRVAVYAGSACPTATTVPAGCDDTTAGCSGNGGRVTLDVTAGSTWLIRVGAPVAGVGGSGALSITCVTACAADLNGDGLVDGNDLGVLLGSWGTAGGDLDGSGITDGADLGVMLGSWGPC
ncbi:MAG: hypothetical protein FJ270_06190 [Planctomycetes bacterium]|nr:hypothetical protein [Planctomycetota bacterium]